MNIPTIKDSILQIKKDFGFKGKNLDNFILLFTENVWDALFSKSNQHNAFGMDLGNVLFQGMETILSKVNDLIGEAVENYISINENRNKFKEIINSNHLNELYSQYIYISKTSCIYWSNFGCFKYRKIK